MDLESLGKTTGNSDIFGLFFATSDLLSQGILGHMEVIRVDCRPGVTWKQPLMAPTNAWQCNIEHQIITQCGGLSGSQQYKV